MMKKGGACWVCFAMVLCLFVAGVCARAQDEETEIAPANPVLESDFKQQVNQRLEPLRSANLEALKAAKEECWRKAQELGARGPELRRELRDAYEAARQNSDIAKDYQRRIAELEQQMEQALRDLPEVKAKLAELQQVERDMLVELQVRTALDGLIAAREKEAAQPE